MKHFTRYKLCVLIPLLQTPVDYKDLVFCWNKTFRETSCIFLVVITSMKLCSEVLSTSTICNLVVQPCQFFNGSKHLGLS